MKKLIYSMLVALSAVFLFTGCQTDDPIKSTEFTVTFNSDGGSEVSAVKVEENEKLSKPTDPTKGEFIFAGWFKEATRVNAWDFDKDVVTKNITLYAKWTTVTYTVTFDTNGGSDVAPLTVAKGSTAVKPLPPTKSNAAFDNWYQESALTNVYDFSTAVNSNITLYAKWITVTRDALQTLVNAAQQVNSSKYTYESYEAMAMKREAAQQVLQSENPTSQQIATAYAELSAAMNALVTRPYKEVAGIYISDVIDGVLYVTPGQSFQLYASAEDATGNNATDSRVTFTYDDAKLDAWTEWGIQKDDNRLWFSAKSTLTPGETVSVTVKSAENPAISKTVTLKVAGQGELKTMFINAVNALPAPDKIAYEHYEAIRKANNMYWALSDEDRQDATVIAAKEKLGKCSDAYEHLPERIKYSFKGNICTFTSLWGSEEEAVGEFIFAANGAFPAGTYTQNGWSEGEKDNVYYQFRLTLKNDGTGLSEERTATDANGTNPTAWKEASAFTYTNQGTQAAGGMFLMTFEREEPELPEPGPVQGVKSVRSASTARTPHAIFKMGR